MSERTALYRFYDANDGLLYVGISKRLGSRWGDHAKAQPWWLEVQRQTVIWLSDWDTAQDAETAAIKSEHPRYNITHNVDPDTGMPMRGKLNSITDWRATGRINMTVVRQNLRTVVDHVERQRVCLVIGKFSPWAALVPAELAQAVQAVGGPDAALKLLRSAS